MDEKDLEKDSAIVKDNDFINKKIQSVPKPKVDIGTDNSIINKITDSEDTTSTQYDLNKLNQFTQVSTRRDQIYNLIDQMAEDPTIAAILETYAEDATEYNDKGQIVWVQAADANVNKYISWLLDTMQVDKHIYDWVYSMCKYGDVYLQLYRQSEFDADKFFEKKKDILKEDVNVVAFSKNDKLVHYLEKVPNPGEMFELTRLGKTAGFIKADVQNNMTKDAMAMPSMFTQYRFKKNDVTLYNYDKFVHATLEDNTSRYPEEVELFLNDEDYNKNIGTKYNVRKGQSLLYNVFKIWRELSLLENSILLNRITKSAIVRLINVEVGDMDKSMVGPHLQGIKAMMEQKSAINAGQSINEYNNPGPIENNIYVPTYNGKGAITADQIGGDVNVGDLPDVEYFQNKFFGALRIPKQYFGLTDDGAGFNGGQSLAIISSRYAKMIKRIQNSILQALTDAINIMLIDKGLDKYVNQFYLHMQPPTTQEEIDRRENLSSKVQMARDIMDLVTQDIDDPVIKIQILKSLVSDVVTDSDVINLIDEQIEKLKAEIETNVPKTNDNDTPADLSGEDFSSDFESEYSEPLNLDTQLDLGSEETLPETEESEENILPTGEELGIDLTDNTLSQEETQ